MGILAEIFSPLLPVSKGRKGAAEGEAAVIAAELALAKLAESRTKLQSDLGTAWDQRSALLDEDGTDAAIAEIDASRDRMHLELERLDRAEPKLLAALDGARAARQRAQWRRLLDDWNATVPHYVETMREANRIFLALAAIRERGQQLGFSTEVTHAFPMAPTMVHDIALLNGFEADVRRRVEDKPAALPQPPPPVRKVQPAEKVPPAPPGPLRTVRKPAGAGLPPDGHVSMRVMRNGYCPPDGEARELGEIVHLPPDMAKIAAANGAVEYAGEAR